LGGNGLAGAQEIMLPLRIALIEQRVKSLCQSWVKMPSSSTKTSSPLSESGWGTQFGDSPNTKIWKNGKLSPNCHQWPVKTDETR